VYNGENSGLGTLFFQAPAWPFFGKLELQKHHSQAGGFTDIKLSRHSGMDRRNPDCRDANNLCHPWSLDSGDPCRNDEFFLNLMAVKRELGNEQNETYSVFNIYW